MRYRFFVFTLALLALGCKAPLSKNLPPNEMLMHPGPGVDGPGPGVMMLGDPGPQPFPGPVSQVAFLGPDGMVVNWDVTAPRMFDSEPLVCPGRSNFPQGALYQLKLTNVPGQAGIELYPTLEIAPVVPRTDAYLAHNAIPVQITDEDFAQVLSGNFVTKVIYLPDAEFADIALSGVDTLVSTRLDPGLDPIVEADRRGAVLAIIRMGNKDLEVPGGEAMGNEGMQAGYCDPMTGDPLNNVAGMTAPEYGMPITGTPIGLPGPAHIPLGVPAGLQRHVIRNHTLTRIPQPTKAIRMHVRQTPGLSYPKPPSRVFIHEHAFTPFTRFRSPLSKDFQSFEGQGSGVMGASADSGADCADESYGTAYDE